MRSKLLLALVVLSWIAAPAQKKKKEEITQTLQLPKELPNAISGDTRNITFHVTPLSNKGLLSQQIRDALKALAHESGSDTILKIRAFVAGTGDLRRVRDLVSEVFTDRRQPLPVLSLIQAGGLPMEGSQVVLEAIAQSKKEVNPGGLVFVSAQHATSANPMDPIPPLTTKSLAALHDVVKAAGSEPADVARVTCFLSSLENVAASRQLVAAEYPHAALDFVQTQRGPAQALAACEAVAKLRWNTGTRIHLLNSEAGASQAALVKAPHLVFTGTQISFGYEEKDSRLAFDRLGKALEQAGVSRASVVFAHYYPLSPSIAAQVRKIGTGFFDASHPPAGTMLLFEGLPSMDAGFAVDLVAAKD